MTHHGTTYCFNFSRFFWAAGAISPLSGMVSAYGLYLPLGMQAVANRPDRISLPINLPAGQTALHPQWQDTGLRQAATVKFFRRIMNKLLLSVIYLKPDKF